MDANRFIKLIEEQADRITDYWLRDVRRHPTTPSYHRLPEEDIRSQAYFIYRNLGLWVGKGRKEEIARYFQQWGHKRRQEGVRISEAVNALILARRHLWLFVDTHTDFGRVLDLYQALDLVNEVILVFDRAIYYTILGYEQP